jgi:hypothetical protein
MDNLIDYRRSLPQGGEEHCVLHTRNSETLRELMQWLDARLAATDALPQSPSPTAVPLVPDEAPITPDSSWRERVQPRRGRPFQYVRMQLEAFDSVYGVLKQFAPSLADSVLAGITQDNLRRRGRESASSSRADATQTDS